jgi:hypothetical protein
MTFEFHGTRLPTSEGATVEFDHTIREVVEVGDVLIVLLDVPPKESMTENVFGVSKAGQILWQIERIPATATDPVNCYTSIFPPKGGIVRLYNWNGTGVRIDPQTGKVLATWFGK